MAAFRQDVSFAFRTMRRRPWFSAAAILTLSLGIGVTTTMFTVVNGAILQPLPYDHPDELVHLQGTRNGARGATISYPDFEDFQATTSAFAALAAWQPWEVTLEGEAGVPTRVQAASVSSEYFHLLRVAPVLGRSFIPEEGLVGHDPAVMLSYPLWQRVYGGDDRVIGSTMELEGEVYTIVGVAPQGFVEPMVATSRYPQPQLWRVRPPIFDAGRASRSWRGFWVVGRLREGVAAEAARREADLIAARLQAAFPESNTGHGFAITSFADATIGDARHPFALLMAVVGLVLLIACVNVTNLLLSSANARRGEFAVRLAIGAPRGRLVRQLLTESLALAILGALGGLVLAVVATRVLLAVGGHGIPRAETIGIDATVLAFTTAVALLTVVLFGLVPAVRGSRLGALGARETGGRRRDRLRSALVVAEVAMAVMILVGAGLVIKSLWRLGAVDPGLQVDHLLTFRVTPPSPAYPTTTELWPVIKQIEGRLAAVPGVEAAGGITDLPMSGAVNSVTARRDDLPPPRPGEALLVLIRAVTPAYFTTAGIAMLEGRHFEDSDREDGEPVMIINTALAERLFPGEAPVGMQVTIMGTSRRIVGVVRAVRQFGPARPSEPAVYIPYAQISGNEWLRRSVTFLVRTSGDDGPMAATIRQAVGAVDGTIPINDLQAMATVFATNVAAPRFRTLLFSVFGLLALTLAAVGIGGVMAFSLSQRAREIAIRLAIGAEPRRVLRLLLGQGLRLTALGALIGVGASVWLSRLLAAVLFSVDPHDPLIFASATAVLTGVGAVASYLPARRATRIAPASVLQGE